MPKRRKSERTRNLSGLMPLSQAERILSRPVARWTDRGDWEAFAIVGGVWRYTRQPTAAAALAVVEGMLP